MKPTYEQLEAKIENLERALRIESQEPVERSQEASHYNWLDDKNAKLEARVKELTVENEAKFRVMQEGRIKRDIKISELQAQLSGVVSALNKVKDIVCPDFRKFLVEKILSTLPQDWLKLREAEEDALEKTKRFLNVRRGANISRKEFIEIDRAFEDSIILLESLRKEVKV